jgi:c-di-GMP-binding flagellar brake protein YcgR
MGYVKMLDNNIEKKSFVNYSLDQKEEKEIINVRLNDSERLMIEESKKILHQNKDSSTLKQLAEIGYKCITSQQNKTILEIVFRNKQNNKRTGNELIE